MKRIIIIALLCVFIIHGFSLERSYNFDVLPKTEFRNERSISSQKKGGFVGISASSAKNRFDVAMPDKKLMRGFERFQKVDAFGDAIPDSFLFYRSELSADQKSAYDEVYKALMNASESVDLIVRIKTDEFMPVIEAVYFDNPELFWWDSTTSWRYNSDGTVTKVMFKYLFSEDKIQDRYSLFLGMSFPVLFYASMLKDDMEKVKYIHDYLCLSVEYDHEAFNSGNYGGKLQTAYSAVCEYKTVCAGYSRAFAYYMQQLRIPCVVLHGSGHAWNMIQIGGDFYQMDVTWDDGQLVPEFFNLTHAQMQSVEMHAPEPFPAEIIRKHPSRSSRMSYKNYFGSIPIGRPFTYKEFRNIVQDIENPLFAEVCRQE